MGLDTTHDCWNGPYSSFGAFREEIAAQVGENLKTFEGFGGDKSFNELKHPVKPLLDHSDCDGELTPAECESIVDGLNQIIAGFKECKFLQRDSGEHFIERCERFRDGCLKAIAAKEKVEFH